MKINIYILSIILLSALSLNAQLSTYEKPPSYSMKSELLKYDDKNIKVMPPIDLAKLLEEDKEEEPRGFATELVIGDESVLEYYTPKEQTEEAIISIDYVVQGYKKLAFLNKYYGKEENELQDYGSSGACQVNVNCSPEGDDWQMEKRAVAMIVVNGHRSCSGSLNGFGVTQGGFSGSPFLNTRHRISGYLRNGSESSITNPSERYSEYVYFGFSWFNYPNADYRRRLNYWLDPSNSGRLTLDGLSNCREKIVNYNINSNTTIGCDQVKFHNSTINNNAKVMIQTKKLIIQDNFRLESGNRFEVRLSPQKIKIVKY